MVINFTPIAVGTSWDRKELALLWGYASFHAIAKGVITPANDNKIVLFVTEDKQQSATQYADTLQGSTLYWEGEDGHRTDQRVAEASAAGDEIHLFYRERHHSLFRYLGQIRLRESRVLTHKPSEFVFDLCSP